MDAPNPQQPIELVTVFASGNQADLIAAKLALESGPIPFIAKGEGVQDVVGFGRLFGGANLLTGPVELQVRGEDAEFARELLSDAGVTKRSP